MSDLDKEKNKPETSPDSLCKLCGAVVLLIANNLLLLCRSDDRCELCLFDFDVEIQNKCLIM
jgi:hypothetical protein